MINGLFSRKLAFAKEGCFDWNYIKISDMFEPVIDKNHPDDTVLTIIQGLGTVPRNSMDRHISYNKESVNSYKRVKKGDFILHLRSFEGGLEVANEQGIVSPAYTILRSKGNIATKFYYAYFRSFEFIENKLRISVEGIRDGKSINMQTFWNIPIPVPKIDEQYKIASFLEKIDNKITYEINLLDKIEKQKSALLSEMFI